MLLWGKLSVVIVFLSMNLAGAMHGELRLHDSCSSDLEPNFAWISLEPELTAPGNFSQELAWDGRSGPGRGGAADLRFPHFSALRLDPDLDFLSSFRHKRQLIICQAYR